MTVMVDYGRQKISGSKDALCYIEGIMWKAVDYADANGMEWLSEKCRADANAIHDALDKAGYFDNVKRV